MAWSLLTVQASLTAQTKASRLAVGQEDLASVTLTKSVTLRVGDIARALETQPAAAGCTAAPWRGMWSWGSRSCTRVVAGAGSEDGNAVGAWVWARQGGEGLQTGAETAGLSPCPLGGPFPLGPDSPATSSRGSHQGFLNQDTKSPGLSCYVGPLRTKVGPTVTSVTTVALTAARARRWERWCCDKERP